MDNIRAEDETKKNLSDHEIDQIVIAQAEEDSAWERPVYVRKAKPASVAIPADLVARAAFLARLHRRKSVAERLHVIIQERVELEKAAFVGMKQDLNLKTG